MRPCRPIVAALFAVLLAGHGPVVSQQHGPARHAVHVAPAVIVDRTGFERPMAAWTLFVPAGWRTEGGVEWSERHLCTNGFAIDWRATAPDGAASIAVLPQHGWSASNYGAPPSAPGCANEPHRNVRQYLESLLHRLRLNARVLDYRARDDLPREFKLEDKVTPMPLGDYRTWHEGGEILFAFQQAGQDMRGAITALVRFDLMRTNAGTGEMRALNGHAYPAWAATAPNGQLDLARSEALRRSIRTDAQWLQRISGHDAAIAASAIREAGKRSAIVAQTSEEIARIRRESWNAYQQSADRRAREFGEAIRGVETYDDPKASGGRVELSHHYSQAWRLGDGSYFLTNDPNFDPWRDLRIDGQRLTPSR